MTAAQHLDRQGLLRQLVDVAVLAPSGDNTQPWQFATDPTVGTITLRVDESRDTSPMNAGQRMSRIAVGAAAENILQTAAANDLAADLIGVTRAGVSIRLNGALGGPAKIPDAITRRCTNRRLYEHEPLPNPVLQALQHQMAELDQVRTHWVSDAQQIARIAALVRRADTIMFGTPALMQAFLKNVRFDRPDHEPVTEGLSLASLELAGAERSAFRLLPRLPAWLVNLMRVPASIGRQSEKLVRSASGLCLGIAADESPQTDFMVGQAMQRAWLALTGQGLAVQPMMSLIVLQNLLLHDDEIKTAVGEAFVRRVLADLLKIVPELKADRPAFLLRFGTSGEPAGRCGRRSGEAVI